MLYESLVASSNYSKQRVERHSFSLIRFVANGSSYLLHAFAAWGVVIMYFKVSQITGFV